MEKISSLKLFSDHFYGQSIIKTVRGPLLSTNHEEQYSKTFPSLSAIASVSLWENKMVLSCVYFKQKFTLKVYTNKHVIDIT